MLLRRTMVAALALLALKAQEPGSFELLGTYRGLGGLVASTVGPGPTENSQRFYLSYLYLDNTIDVVAVDPATGEFQVFANPALGESGARCIVTGRDENLYFGTLPRAHFLKLDPKAGVLVDLGRPSATEQYIWDVALGADGKIYGATYPQAKLVRYDPDSGALADLGRLDPVEQYARWIAASDDGFLYVGIGSAKANFAAYEIATGEKREILAPEYQIVAIANVYRGQDGKVYGSAGSQYFRLEGWTATPIARGEAAPAEPKNRLANGHTVTVSGRNIRVTDPATRTFTERRFEYEGNELPIFRVALGPDGELYGSAVLPANFLTFDRAAGAWRELGNLGGGEFYSLLAKDGRLLMAGYSTTAPLMVFDPAKPFQQGAGEKNPLWVTWRGAESDWRPQALLAGPGGVYIGAVSGYGKLGGPLAVWDVDGGTVDLYPHLVEDHSVVSLAAWKQWIVGGTTVGGGGGSRPTQKEAKVFLWGPETREKRWEIVPVPGATAITDLIAAPNGLVYGIAGRTMFALDPETLDIVARQPAPFTSAIYNSVAIGPDGRIWGLGNAGIFAIDTATNEIALVAASPKPITAGFAMDAASIYFASGPAIYRYRLPE